MSNDADFLLEVNGMCVANRYIISCLLQISNILCQSTPAIANNIHLVHNKGETDQLDVSYITTLGLLLNFYPRE